MFKLSKALATLACSGFATGPTYAAVVFSGNFNGGTGQVQFESDFTFTLTSSLSAPSSIVLIFDEAVTSDLSRNFLVSDAGTPLAFELNDTSYSRSFTLADNLNVTSGVMTANDSYLFWASPANLSPGDTVVIQAGTYGVQSGTSFNPQLNALTFTGDMFLANAFGAQISSVIAAVPEPRVYATLTGIGLLLTGLCLSSRRSHLQNVPSQRISSASR